MATEVIHGKNMFHMEYLQMVVPFMDDRGAHDVQLIQKLSVPYSSPVLLNKLRR